MNQADFVNAIAANPANEGVSKQSIKWVLDRAGEITQTTLAAGGEITLPGIGKLSVTERTARVGRNPATGASMDIPAKKVPKFAAAKALKDAVA